MTRPIDAPAPRPTRSVSAHAALLALALTLIHAPAASAAVCSASVQGVAFGGYDPFSNIALDSTGNVAVTCDVGTPYSISLSPGGGSYTARAMANGAHPLHYNLYTDATRTTVWGDGTGGTAIVSDSAASANHTVYGRISAGQNAYVGSYSDTVTVTVTY